MKKLILLTLVGFGWGICLAQEAFAFENVRGFVMLDWFQTFQQDAVAYGSAGGALSGLALSAGLNADIADVQFGLTLANVGLDRQDVEFKVTHRNMLGVVSFENTPPPFGSDARKTNLLALASLQFEALPELSATFVRTTQGGDNGYGVNALDLELSDRYKELDPRVDEFRWRVGYGLETSSFVTEGLADELTHSVSTRLKAELLSDEGVALSPELKAELSFSTEEETTRLKQKYDLKTELEATEFETVTAALKVTAETEKALKDTESISVTSSRLEPVTLSASVSRSAKGDEQTFSWSAGADYPFGERLSLGGTYNGSAGATASHSLAVDLTYREQPWSAQASAEAGVQADEEDGFSPSFRLDFSASHRAKEAWSGQVKGNIQYQLERLTGSLDASAEYEAEAFSVSGSGGLLYSDALSLRLSVDGFISVYDALAVHTNAAYRTSLETGGNALTLGLGVRYTFGGDQ